jgi:hypothetical protein
MALQSQTFASSGTFNVPANVSCVFSNGQGSGGGGCASIHNQAAKGAGGSGELWLGLPIPCTPGGTLTVTVDPGGAGGTFVSGTTTTNASGGGPTSVGGYTVLGGDFSPQSAGNTTGGAGGGPNGAPRPGVGVGTGLPGAAGSAESATFFGGASGASGGTNGFAFSGGQEVGQYISPAAVNDPLGPESNGGSGGATIYAIGGQGGASGHGGVDPHGAGTSGTLGGGGGGGGEPSINSGGFNGGDGGAGEVTLFWIAP